MKLLKKLADFFAKTPNSAPGLIVPEELFRAIVAAISGGGLIGVLIAVLTAVSASAATIFPNPITATLASAFLGLVLDLLRRQNQGVKTSSVLITYPEVVQSPATPPVE